MSNIVPAKVYKNVLGLDFNSLYPSNIISYNISPETFVENGYYKIDCSDD